MIRTLAWKEIREHQGIWITMVFMSIALGLGLSKLVALGDANIALPVATFTILGMAATYGVVCGAMMFAGEHEGGTLVFLDIFHGRRGRLWTGKFAIGCVFALTQGLVVAALLGWLQPESPRWVQALVGYGEGAREAVGGVSTDPRVWFLVLPVVTLEAFFWGLLGSSLSQRVLVGAAVAAAIFTPILLVSICAPPQVFLAIRLVSIACCLGISFAIFVGQSQDGTSAPERQPRAERIYERKEQFLERWASFERVAELEEIDEPPQPVSIPETRNDRRETWGEVKTPERTPSSKKPSPIDVPDQPGRPTDALWWLTCQQAMPTFWLLALGGLFIGLFIIPFNVQVLWPIFTMLLGVACGTAAFGPEQRDLSYQFLSGQHLPLRLIWRFKILFWLGAALLIGVVMLSAVFIGLAFFSLGRAPINFGTFIVVTGPTLFLGAWLFYGFATGQLVVWLCRKQILALLASSLAAAAAIGLWLPTLVCGGMSGWQMWIPPLTMLIATLVLVRAWAGGRIWERKPLAALIGYGGAILGWALIVFAWRALEIPNVGAPLDVAAFRDSLPGPKDNDAAKAIQKAVAEVGEPNEEWLKSLKVAAKLPLGVIDMPRSDGSSSALTHLTACRQMTEKLLQKARAEDRGPAFDRLALIFMLSRTLRNKAPLDSYLVGIELEDKALNGLDDWLARGMPDAQVLRQVLVELNRHAKETPPPSDCVKTECYRSGGVVENPAMWTFSTPGGNGRMPERWLANGIAVSLEAPWEAERKMRIWRLVWSGLIRNLETPHWELPESPAEVRADKAMTHKIMEGYLPEVGGTSQERVVRLLDSSWLPDEQIFPSVKRLRKSATRARWRAEAMRQVVALGLHQLEQGKAAPDLDALVPNYFPAALPIDPYSGKSYRYRLDAQNGQADLWSTGPDRIDHGGRRDGQHLDDDQPGWRRGELDLIVPVPAWR